MSQKNYVKTLLFFILIYVYACKNSNNTDESHHNYYKIVDDSVFNFTHEDSIKMKEIDTLYTQITIPKHWLNTQDTLSYIAIHKDFFDISIIYEMADTGGMIKINGIKNYADSSAFSMSNGSAWIFRDHKNNTGSWTLSKHGKRTPLGQYRSND